MKGRVKILYVIFLLNFYLIKKKKKKEISANHKEESVENTRVTTVEEDIVCHSRGHLSVS